MSAISSVAQRSPKAGATAAAVAACWMLSVAIAIAVHVLAPLDGDQRVQAVMVAAVAVVPLCAGALIAVRAPGNAAGPLVAAAGLTLVATNVPVGQGPPVLDGDWVLLYLPFAILLLVVPDGRAAGRRWRAVGWAITAVSVGFMSAIAAANVHPGAAFLTEPAVVALLPAFALLLLACAAAPAARYRRAGDHDRARLRWIFLAGMSLPLALLMCWTSYLIFGTPDLVVAGLLLMYVAIPVCTAVALIRPGLLDIDRAVVATIAATLLGVAVLGALSIVAAIVGLALIDWSPIAAIGVTTGAALAAAAAFRPLRATLRRLLYPEHARALAALRTLGTDVAAGRRVPEDVEDVLRTALRDPLLQIGYRLPGGSEPCTFGGDRLTAGATTAVRVRGEEVAAIAPDPARLTRLAAEVVRAAAPLIDAARTRAELARTNAELTASRHRLLTAGYEERRRLERDLHDGAQQRLVALGMRLRVLQRASRADGALAQSLDGAVAEVSLAVAELRRLAQGVRPSALDDGLGPALADLVRRAPVDVDLEVDAAALPDPVAMTAYFVVSEAIVNALRHSSCTRIRVGVVRYDATVQVRVDDDGAGGACFVPSGGLAGLCDRVEATGGRLTLTSAAGGTTLEAMLPCAS